MADPLELRPLGGTGITVTHLMLGAMMFGPGGNEDRDECVAMIHRALDSGINCIDTADAYSRGISEEIVGTALVGRRDDIVLATKVFFPMGKDPNERGGSRRWIIREVEASLRRLRTDWIDLYQLHRRDPSLDFEESISAMSDLVRAGKVRAFGMSGSSADWIVEAQWIAERRHLVRPRSEQHQYSIFSRQGEATVFPACRRHGMGVVTYGPLNGGWLTGKYRPAATPEDSRASRQAGFSGRWDPEREAVQRKYGLLERLDELAASSGLSLVELAYGFAREHPAVSAVIIGPRTPEQLDVALAAAAVRLPSDVLNAIDAIVPPGHDVDRGDSAFTDPELADPALRRRG